jgi:hypothetical protein
MQGEIAIVAKDLIVPEESYFQSPFFVKIDRRLIQRRKTPLVLGIYEGDKKIQTVTTTFWGPGY